MKAIYVASMLMVFSFSGAVRAQNAETASEISTKTVTGPELSPEAAAAAAEKKAAVDKVREKHSKAVAALKRKQHKEIVSLRAKLKGEPAEEVEKALAAKKKEHHAELVAIEMSTRKDIERERKVERKLRKKKGN